MLTFDKGALLWCLGLYARTVFDSWQCSNKKATKAKCRGCFVNTKCTPRYVPQQAFPVSLQAGVWW